MINKERHEKLAFKQIVRLEWMDRTLNLVLAGLSEKEIRADLDWYLSTQMQKGGEGAIRNKATYGMTICLLSCWFREDAELDSFRKDLLAAAKRTDQSHWLPLHMALLCASNPFFMQVCFQVGKLYSLQDQISSSQVYNRMKDIYGDKETTARNTRYAIRTLVSWGMIKDISGKKGLYGKGENCEIYDKKTIALLLEGILLSLPDERSEINSLQKNDSMFSFSFDYMSAGMLSSLSNGRIVNINFGLSNEFVSISQHC
ncbi:MAG: hypothetical protein WCR02_09845 [Sphaerochaetaceae bacterium]